MAGKWKESNGQTINLNVTFLYNSLCRIPCLPINASCTISPILIIKFKGWAITFKMKLRVTHDMEQQPDIN